jgi:hypothetical protein
VTYRDPKRYEEIRKKIFARVDASIASEIYLLFAGCSIAQHTLAGKEGPRYLTDPLLIEDKEVASIDASFDLDLRDENGGRYSFNPEGLAECVGRDVIDEVRQLKLSEAFNKSKNFKETFLHL